MARTSANRIWRNLNQAGRPEDHDVSDIGHRWADQGDMLGLAGLGLLANPLRARVGLAGAAAAQE